MKSLASIVTLTVSTKTMVIVRLMTIEHASMFDSFQPQFAELGHQVELWSIIGCKQIMMVVGIGPCLYSYTLGPHF